LYAVFAIVLPTSARSCSFLQGDSLDFRTVLASVVVNDVMDVRYHSFVNRPMLNSIKSPGVRNTVNSLQRM
ncbi:hypothetical protein PENTCL1PPCAC_8822, partial [Pristionchus entomophagus]